MMPPDPRTAEKRLRAAAMLVNGGWHSVVEGDNVRMRYASDLPSRLNTLRAALAAEPVPVPEVEKEGGPSDVTVDLAWEALYANLDGYISSEYAIGEVRAARPIIEAAIRQSPSIDVERLTRAMDRADPSLDDHDEEDHADHLAYAIDIAAEYARLATPPEP